MTSAPDCWSIDDVREWLLSKSFDKYAALLCDTHLIDGKTLIVLSEVDLKEMGICVVGDLKRISLALDELRKEHLSSISYNPNLLTVNGSMCCEDMFEPSGGRFPMLSPSLPSCDFRPEITKAVLAFFYLFLSCFVTSVVMVIAHDRVPNGTVYPPLPDVILENVPYISWAFEGAEICAIILFSLWAIILLLHRHKFIIFRRLCALGGTIFLLRSVTMLITTLSIPGEHIDCASTRPTADIWSKISRGLRIWSGFGMQLQGVRTCGDYMFSGHTVVLTLLTFSVCEYTPRSWHFLHNVANLLNFFGIFFILAGHEHYSIDVFVAYYITSRMFLYYHSMANSRVLMQLDDLHRTKTWFPLFSFFESQCHGVVPNEYEFPWVSWRRRNEKPTTNGSCNGGVYYKPSPNRLRTPSERSVNSTSPNAQCQSPGGYVFRVNKAD